MTVLGTRALDPKHRRELAGVNLDELARRAGRSSPTASRAR
ncbi:MULTISPECIES: hypothetical protein [unclassified Microbispora]|nr:MULTISPECIES: hypothetical protein [unclassified Microbispora]